MIGFFTLIGQSVGDFFSFDSKLPRSVLVAFIPGELPLKYLSGHRVPYLSPIRFAVSASILLFTVIALLPGVIAPPTLETPISSDMRYIAREGAGFVSLGLILIAPAFAGLLSLAFIDKKRRFVEHLTIALYYHATLCLVLVLVSLIVATNFQEIAIAFSLVLLLWVLIPHMVIMLRRTLAIGWLRLALTVPVLTLFYAVTPLLVFGAVAGYLGAHSTAL